MKTALFTHNDCLAHDTGAGHPECVERLAAIMAMLKANNFFDADVFDAPKIALETLYLVHDPDYVSKLAQINTDDGLVFIDPETVISEGTHEAALRAAGGVIAAVDAVMNEGFDNAFCAVRPPGHHAGSTYGMGFCFFNNVAIGAAYALSRGVKNVVLLDFDVHHGNGTQEWALGEKRAHYYSTHEKSSWPGTGFPHETGVHSNITNMPLDAGTGSAEFRAAWSSVIAELEANKPEMIFVSAGFDAHTDDPLGNLNVDEKDYGWLTAELCHVAKKTGAKIVSALEGGYNIDALTRSVEAHVRALRGEAFA